MVDRIGVAAQLAHLMRAQIDERHVRVLADQRGGVAIGRPQHLVQLVVVVGELGQRTARERHRPHRLRVRDDDRLAIGRQCHEHDIVRGLRDHTGAGLAEHRDLVRRDLADPPRPVVARDRAAHDRLGAELGHDTVESQDLGDAAAIDEDALAVAVERHRGHRPAAVGEHALGAAGTQRPRDHVAEAAAGDERAAIGRHRDRVDRPQALADLAHPAGLDVVRPELAVADRRDQRLAVRRERDIEHPVARPPHVAGRAERERFVHHIDDVRAIAVGDRVQLEPGESRGRILAQ